MPYIYVFVCIRDAGDIDLTRAAFKLANPERLYVEESGEDDKHRMDISR